MSVPPLLVALLLGPWQADPAVLLTLGIGAGLYLAAYTRGRRLGKLTPPVWQVLAYLAGIAALAFALIGPPDTLNAALFTVHMVQHLLLTLVAPPLVLLGRPAQVLLRGLPSRPLQALLRATIGRSAVRSGLAWLTHPVTVGLLYNGALLLWHLPPLYEAAVQIPPLHLLEHASFVATALLFWWVLIDPLPRRQRLATSTALLLLFATWMIGDLLGATLTLGAQPLYPLYARDRNPWGLSPLADQQLGGLLMWASGGVFYAVVMLGLLAHPYLRRRPQTQPAA